MTDAAADLFSPHALYVGRVAHTRLRPFRHSFAYRVYTLLLDLDRLDRLPRLLARNRFGLFGFHDRDHGSRDGSPLRPWVEAQARDAGIELCGGRIRLLCFPRVLGYVFNPLSIYFCEDAAGRLRAILYEVKNTFGDQHCYLCPVTADRPGLPHDQQQDKAFHVSPFLPVAGTYRFRLTVPAERLAISIRQDDGTGAEILLASQTGRRRDLSSGSLLRAFLTHPLVTLKVVAAIHWQALHLWRKGARFHRRPPGGLKPETPTDTLKSLEAAHR